MALPDPITLGHANLLAWLTGNAGITLATRMSMARGMSVVRSVPSTAGTAPPALTITGSTTWALAPLRVECTLGGALATARGRWTVDIDLQTGGALWHAFTFGAAPIDLHDEPSFTGHVLGCGAGPYNVDNRWAVTLPPAITLTGVPSAAIANLTVEFTNTTAFSTSTGAGAAIRWSVDGVNFTTGVANCMNAVPLSGAAAGLFLVFQYGTPITGFTYSLAVPPPITLGGTLTQATPFHVRVDQVGDETHAVLGCSLDGGATWPFQVTAGAGVAIGGTGLTITCAAGQYPAGALLRVTVAVWTDRSINAYTLAERVAGTAPALCRDVNTGKNYLQLDGAQYMVSVDGSTLPTMICGGAPKAFTILASTNCDEQVVPGSSVLSICSSASANQRYVVMGEAHIASSGFNTRTVAQRGDAAPNPTTFTVLSPLTRCTENIEWRYDATIMRAHVNGVDIGSQAQTFTTRTPTHLVLGAFRGGGTATQFYRGRWYDLIAFHDSDLPEADRDNHLAYLNQQHWPQPAGCTTITTCADGCSTQIGANFRLYGLVTMLNGTIIAGTYTPVGGFDTPSAGGCGTINVHYLRPGALCWRGVMGALQSINNLLDGHCAFGMIVCGLLGVEQFVCMFDVHDTQMTSWKSIPGSDPSTWKIPSRDLFYPLTGGQTSVSTFQDAVTYPAFNYITDDVITLDYREDRSGDGEDCFGIYTSSTQTALSRGKYTSRGPRISDGQPYNAYLDTPIFCPETGAHLRYARLRHATGTDEQSNVGPYFFQSFDRGVTWCKSGVDAFTPGATYTLPITEENMEIATPTGVPIGPNRRNINQQGLGVARGGPMIGEPASCEWFADTFGIVDYYIRWRAGVTWNVRRLNINTDPANVDVYTMGRPWIGWYNGGWFIILRYVGFGPGLWIGRLADTNMVSGLISFVQLLTLEIGLYEVAAPCPRAWAAGRIRMLLGPAPNTPRKTGVFIARQAVPAPAFALDIPIPSTFANVDAAPSTISATAGAAQGGVGDLAAAPSALGAVAGVALGGATSLSAAPATLQGSVAPSTIGSVAAAPSTIAAAAGVAQGGAAGMSAAGSTIAAATVEVVDAPHIDLRVLVRPRATEISVKVK